LVESGGIAGGTATDQSAGVDQMFARSTTVTSQPSAIERSIRYFQDDLMPEILNMPGCVGLSLLVDHATSRCIATSSWLDEEAMHATTDSIRRLRDRFIAEAGGSDTVVDEWEVALMHRDHSSIEGARARVTWLQGSPASVDPSVESFRAILPLVDQLPGFCSASLLVNRRAGRAVSTVTYDSADTLTQTRTRANNLRSQLAAQTGAEVLEVAEFELAVAHLRVPEMV
jgi:quinol monooxygenase YgiN